MGRNLKIINILRCSSDFAEALGEGPSGRCFGIIKKGYFALLSKNAEVGDHVVIFLGGNVPFVLRKVASEHTLEYKLVGECYVYGVMEGVIFEGNTPELGGSPAAPNGLPVEMVTLV
jgi:hypothetical protein